ncbi:MAG: class I SAM-dependent methyltransferase [Planctomycetes bacterium]|nr:class I SAM-dependent methyltransferase [Planctomycetota bacterium]
MTDRLPPDLFGRDYLHFYRPVLTAERTRREVAFVERVLALAPGARVLDLCCGHGRHALELARRGYDVTGIDLSAPALELARKAAREARGSGRSRSQDGARVGPRGARRDGSGAGSSSPPRRGAPLRVRFVRGDMRRLERAGEFDAALNLFSSFGYFDDATNADILRRLFAALRPGGRLLLEVRNREAWLRAPRPVFFREVGRSFFVDLSEFDPREGRLHVRRLFVRGARRREVRLSFRLYAWTELRDLLLRLGFEAPEVWGGYGTAYALDADRMLVAARRPKGERSPRRR